MSGILVFGMPRSSKTGPEPSLNQPNLDRTGRDPEVTDSGQFRVDGVCTRKGSSHSGFFMFFFTLLGNRPFCQQSLKSHGNSVPEGPQGGQNGSKLAQYGPYQALRTQPDPDPGYLDLSNTSL